MRIKLNAYSTRIIVPTVPSILSTEDNESPDIAPEAPAKDFNAPYFHFGQIESKF